VKPTTESSFNRASVVAGSWRSTLPFLSRRIRLSGRASTSTLRPTARAVAGVPPGAAPPVGGPAQASCGRGVPPPTASPPKVSWRKPLLPLLMSFAACRHRSRSSLSPSCFHDGEGEPSPACPAHAALEPTSVIASAATAPALRALRSKIPFVSRPVLLAERIFVISHLPLDRLAVCSESAPPRCRHDRPASLDSRSDEGIVATFASVRTFGAARRRR